MSALLACVCGGVGEALLLLALSMIPGGALLLAKLRNTFTSHRHGTGKA